jgi:hypothetical protein
LHYTLCAGFEANGVATDRAVHFTGMGFQQRN